MDKWMERQIPHDGIGCNYANIVRKNDKIIHNQSHTHDQQDRKATARDKLSKRIISCINKT